MGAYYEIGGNKGIFFMNLIYKPIFKLSEQFTMFPFSNTNKHISKETRTALTFWTAGGSNGKLYENTSSFQLLIPARTTKITIISTATPVRTIFSSQPISELI